MEKLDHYLAFLREAELLKSVLRTCWTSSGCQESTAEHSWRLSLAAMLFSEEFPDLDPLRILKMCLIHDLGELYGGDISAALCPDSDSKYAQERQDVEKLFSLLPPHLHTEMLCLWQEYEEGATGEAKLVKALDKAETILQHNQGENPSGFDYQFNLEYGKQYFQENSLLIELRERLDNDTKERIDRQSLGTSNTPHLPS